MVVQLLFLGKLADLAGGDERVLELSGPVGWDELLAALEPALAEQLAGDKIRVALNGTILADKTRLQAGENDELAFLPPVSGG